MTKGGGTPGGTGADARSDVPAAMRGPGKLVTPPAAARDPTKADPDLPCARPRTLLVQDESGKEQEEEQEILAELAAHGIEPRITARRRRFDAEAAERAELVIFDQGGASAAGDGLDREIRRITGWAGDHPSVLIAVWSLLPWKWIEQDARSAELRAPANVMPVGAAYGAADRRKEPRDRLLSRWFLEPGGIRGG